jgi:hypothetical protein
MLGEGIRDVRPRDLRPGHFPPEVERDSRVLGPDTVDQLRCRRKALRSEPHQSYRGKAHPRHLRGGD